MNPAPTFELSRRATTSGRPYDGMSDHGGRSAIRPYAGVGRAGATADPASAVSQPNEAP